VITTNKAAYIPTVTVPATVTPNNDVLVRLGKFPSGRKLVIQKGTTVISVNADDVFDFIDACGLVANDLVD
jgi:hypothetical protein